MHADLCRGRSRGDAYRTERGRKGDKLDIFEKDGAIYMLPVVVYPKKYLEELRGELGEVKAKIASGEQPVFDSVDALFAKLEAD